MGVAVVLVGELVDEVGDVGGREARWDPEGGPGHEGEPVRCVLLDEDALD